MILCTYISILNVHEALNVKEKAASEKILTKLGFLSCVFLFCFTLKCAIFIGESHHQC